MRISCPALRERFIRNPLPVPTDILQLHHRSREVSGEQPGILPLEDRLLAKASLAQATDRHHQMRMMVPDIRFSIGRMDREVDGVP